MKYQAYCKFNMCTYICSKTTKSFSLNLPVLHTECPTRYRTQHFFNNFTTNEDIAMTFEADLPHCVRNVMTS